MQGNHTRITRDSFPPIHPHTNATLRTPPLTFPIHPVRKITFTIYVSSYTWRWFNNPESWPWKTVTFFSSCGIILSPPPSIDLHPFRKQRATGGKQTAAKNETKRNERRFTDDSFFLFRRVVAGSSEPWLKSVKHAELGTEVQLPCVLKLPQCEGLHSIKWYRGATRIFIFSEDVGLTRGNNDIAVR